MQGVRLGLGVLTACAVIAVAGATQSTRAVDRPDAVVLTDAEIAAIVVAANATDADMGEFAATRAKNVAVKEFANTMTRDHRAVNEKAGALLSKLGVKPVENEVSRKLANDGSAVRAELARKSGAEFDRAYIVHEVAYHQAVIDAVDQTLLPNAKNSELKQTIIDVRPALVAHLKHAQQLQSALR